MEARFLEEVALRKRISEKANLNRLVKNYTEEHEDGIVRLEISDSDTERYGFEEVIGFLEERTKYLPLVRGVTIVVDNQSPEKRAGCLEKVRKSIMNALIPSIYYIDMEMKRLMRVSVILMIVGVVAMGSASLIAELKFNAYALHEILVITSWVFIWAAVEKFFFDRGNLKQRRKQLERLYFANYSSSAEGTER